MFNYSLADIAAASGTNDMGNNGIWWIIILLLFAFGGFNGNGIGSNENYTLASDFATIQRQIDSTANATQNMVTTNGDQLQRQITAVANGISSLGYDQLNQMNGINSHISTTGYDMLNAIQNNIVSGMQNTNNINAGITALGTQISNCCCENRYQSATQSADINYRLAEQSCQTRQSVADSTNAITANQDANTRSILQAIQDMQTSALQDKISTLTADNQALKFAASQAAQNAYLVNALNPNYPYGYNCGA